MRCEYCQKEFPVNDERLVGQDVRCPHCGIPGVCSDRRVVIICPACHRDLEGELWMLGNQAECTYCHKEILLSRPENPGDEFSNSYLPGNYVLGNYTLKRCIGAGGMGEVYLAKHNLLERECALKLLRPDRAGTVGDVSFDALVREARLACKIESPHLVAVMDVQVDTERNLGYIVMEYIKGRNVESMLAEHPLHEDHTIEIAKGVCRALIAAASCEVVHRDIKPANIMITDDGIVKLADLGIAKSGRENHRSLMCFSGTVHYAAPEQIMSADEVDCRADIYSLGASMYHMLSGKRPFEGLNARVAISKAVKGEVLPLSKAAPKVSRDCCKLVENMMDPDPAKRPANAEELLGMLEKLSPKRSRKLQLPDFRKIAENKKLLFTAGGIGAAVIIAVIASLLFSGKNAPADELSPAPAPQVQAEAKTPVVPAPQAEAKAPVAPAPAPQAEAKAPVAPAPAPQVQAEAQAPVAPAPAPQVQAEAQAPVAPAPAPQAEAQAPEAPAPQVQAEVKAPAPTAAASSEVNFIRLLILLCWVFSGIKVLGELVKAGRKDSTFVAAYLEYLNLAALAAGPAVWLAVIWKSKFQQKFRKLTASQEKLPVIVDNHGKALFADGENDKDGDVVYYVRKLLANALQLHASDIFLDPKTGDISVLRFRVDGALRVIEEMDLAFGNRVINVFKVVSGMDISERRRPQDGAFSLAGPFGNVSLRVASVGAFSGEKIALRILGDDSGPKTLAAAGLTGSDLATVEQSAKLPSGMVLICGPTGSGKTTTLYAMLNTIDYSIKNVISIEDPIEHVISAISQMEVNEPAGIGFSQLLRNALRQNPDIICLGEIRDEDTAQTAIHAAQTGHLIIATLHSNDNIGTIDRLANLNIPLRSIAGTLRVVVSQRLVRKLCSCKKSASPSDEDKMKFKEFGIDCSKVFVPKGCPKCGNTGYRGRQALFDILAVDDELRELLEDEHTNLSNIQKRLKKSAGGNAMVRSGYALAAKGVTSLDEVRRVTMEVTD